ncbi:hypothetical protein E1263_16780 [Kribbella antibiotica]|uniref:Uncharacterized protein n=1 Tax=Kribbella antibiotica TaxID=190195 RepID=A0A4R4ZK35_9ACTN|nr:hypothetical protein [Kribbella antibiotica]TDD59053.1 hypothetical protein E1263_16780 [Kribbella antibiotica]
MTFVRYQSPVPDRRGRHLGIFGLVNSLGHRSLLTAEEENFRRTTNAWYDATYPNPSDTDPAVYADNPLAAAWFRETADHLVAPIPGYLEILAAHNYPCERYASPDPGRVLYEDEYQVVVVPHAPATEEITTIMWLPPAPAPAP